MDTTVTVSVTDTVSDTDTNTVKPKQLRAEFDDLWQMYPKKQGKDKIFINAEQAETTHDERGREPDAVLVIEGIEVKYYLDTYKWVPSEYELTEQDKKNMEKDNYFISMGASKVSENQVSGVSWVQDGIYYHIGNVYGKTEPEVMFQMAEELIMLK